MDAKPTKPEGGRRQRAAAERRFARFSRCDQGRAEPPLGQSGEEARDKGVKGRNLAKSSDSNHGGFCWKTIAEFEAKAAPIVFLDHVKDLPDRRQRGKVICPRSKILLVCLLAVLAGAESFVAITRFGANKSGFQNKVRASMRKLQNDPGKKISFFQKSSLEYAA